MSSGYESGLGGLFDEGTVFEARGFDGREWDGAHTCVERWSSRDGGAGEKGGLSLDCSARRAEQRRHQDGILADVVDVHDRVLS